MPDDLDTLRADFDAGLNEVFGLHTLRYVWKNILAMVNDRQDLPPNSLINYYLSTTYSHTLAVGIRRECESRDSRATIGSVLRRVGLAADFFTVASCRFDEVENWAGGHHGWLRYARRLDDPLDAERVRAQADELEGDRLAAKRWVDKRIAHRDRATGSATFDDLEHALAGLRNATQFLYGLFNQGGHLGQFTPSPTLGWHQAFSAPWYIPGRTELVDEWTLD